MSLLYEECFLGSPLEPVLFMVKDFCEIPLDVVASIIGVNNDFNFAIGILSVASLQNSWLDIILDQVKERKCASLC